MILTALIVKKKIVVAKLFGLAMGVGLSAVTVGAACAASQISKTRKDSTGTAPMAASEG